MTTLNGQEMGGAGIGLVSLEFFLRAAIKYEKRFSVVFKCPQSFAVERVDSCSHKGHHGLLTNVRVVGVSWAALHATRVYHNMRFKLTISHILFVFLSEGATEDRVEFILFKLMALNCYL